MVTFFGETIFIVAIILDGKRWQKSKKLQYWKNLALFFYSDFIIFLEYDENC